MSIVVNSENSLTAKIAHRLQLAFDARRINPSVVAEELGISSPAVRKWLRTGKIRLENMVEFCDLYSINLEWLLTGRGVLEAESVTSGGGPGLATRDLPVIPLHKDSVSDSGEINYGCSETVVPWTVSDGGAKTAFRVTDNSLSDRYGAGTLLVCDHDRNAVIGDLVVGIVSRGNASFEMVARYKTEPRLGDIQYVSGDLRYPSITPDDFRIIGIVVEARISLH